MPPIPVVTTIARADAATPDAALPAVPAEDDDLPLLTDSEIAGIHAHPNREAAGQRLSQSIALTDTGTLLFCDIVDGIISKLDNPAAARAMRKEIPPCKGAQRLANAWLFAHRAHVASPGAPAPPNPESQRAARLNLARVRARDAFESTEPMSAAAMLRVKPEAGAVNPKK
jgi:hypothetical protein